MKSLRSLYHFLGGIRFALILITTVALFVIVGTFIESLTQSHRYAALFTYDNPLFAALLWGFFINILFAATRRWPFKQKHLPFLTTHLGLLMILAGVLAKHYFGVQGSMSLLEGSGSQEIMETDTYAIHVEKKNSDTSLCYLLHKDWKGAFHSEVIKNPDDLTMRLAKFYPHCTEHLATWIKGSHAFINGLKPMPIYPVTNQEDELPISGKARFHHPEGDVWELYALRTEDLEKTLAKLYAQNAYLEIRDRFSNKLIAKQPLHQQLQLPDGTLLKCHLSLPFSTLEEFQHPCLTVTANTQLQMLVPLNEAQALLNLNHTPSQFGNLSWSLDISRPPLLAILEDEFEDVHLIAFDKDGKVWSESFRKGNLDSLVAYDDGFAGYTTRVELPFTSYKTGRQEREEALNYQLALQLRQALADGTELAPPLQMLQHACLKSHADFSDTATAFLAHWNTTNSWLYPADTPLPSQLIGAFSQLDWKQTPPHIQRACEWSLKLFEHIHPELKKNPDDLLGVLKRNHWPLIEALETESAQNKGSTNKKNFNYSLLTLQLFAASEILPNLSLDQEALKPEMQASLLSAYLRAYDIHLSDMIQASSPQEMNQRLLHYQAAKLLGAHLDLILGPLKGLSASQQAAFIATLPNDSATTKEIASSINLFGEQIGNPKIAAIKEPTQLAKAAALYIPAPENRLSPPLKSDFDSPPIVLETMIFPVQKATLPSKKLEDNFPKITLHVNNKQRSQSLSLAYERTGSGLKWPILDGEYLIRFQPQFKAIPYRVRLRQARQINYANSSQPYSFESDLIITDLRSNSYVEKTISMNNVHETWDGYRFYLSSIAPPNETAVKHIQIIVNYDPAKYWLTYPGALVLSCGILMLFIMRPYRRPKP